MSPHGDLPPNQQRDDFIDALRGVLSPDSIQAIADFAQEQLIAGDRAALGLPKRVSAMEEAWEKALPRVQALENAMPKNAYRRKVDDGHHHYQSVEGMEDEVVRGFGYQLNAIDGLRLTRAAWPNNRRLDISGAGLMGPFEYHHLVDANFAAKVAAGYYTEGQTLETFHGWTFKVWSTVQAAVDDWETDTGDQGILIVPANYAEDVVAHASLIQNLILTTPGTGLTTIRSLTMAGQYSSGLPVSLVENLALTNGLQLGDSTDHATRGLHFRNVRSLSALTFSGVTSPAPISSGIHLVFEDCSFAGVGDDSKRLTLSVSEFTRCTFTSKWDTITTGGASSTVLYRVLFSDCDFESAIRIGKTGNVGPLKFDNCRINGDTTSDAAFELSNESDAARSGLDDLIFAGCVFSYGDHSAEWAFIKIGASGDIGPNYRNLAIAGCTFNVPNLPADSEAPIHILWAPDDPTSGGGSYVHAALVGNSFIEDEDGNRMEDLPTTSRSYSVKGYFERSVFGPNVPADFEVELLGGTNNLYVGTGTAIGDGIVTLPRDLRLPADTELTIGTPDADAITVTQTHHTIDTAGDAASDDLETINGLVANQLYFFYPAHTDRTIVFKHGVDNILCVGDRDITLDDAHDFVWGFSPDGSNIYVSGGDTASDYLLTDGTRPMAAALDMGDNVINNLADPVLGGDAVNLDTLLESLSVSLQYYFGAASVMSPAFSAGENHVAEAVVGTPQELLTIIQVASAADTPDPFTINAGTIVSVHFDAKVLATSGKKPTFVYVQLGYVDADGSSNFVQIGADSDPGVDALTTTQTMQEQHVHVAADTTIPAGKRLKVKWWATTTGALPDPTIWVYYGAVGDHINIPVSAGILGNFLRRDGSTELTADWEPGNARIIGNWLHTEKVLSFSIGDAAFGVVLSAGSPMIVVDTAGPEADYLKYDRATNTWTFEKNSGVVFSIDNSGIYVPTDHFLQFRDADLQIYSSVDGQLDLKANTEIELTAPTVDVQGDITTSGTVDGVDVAARDHPQVHGIADHTEHANWKAFHSDAAGDEQELALGAAGTILAGQGAAAAPAFDTMSGDASIAAGGAVTVVAATGAFAVGGDVDMNGNNIDEGGVIFLIEQAEADADVVGSGQIWVNTATPNELWFTDDAGTDMPLTTPKRSIIIRARSWEPNTTNPAADAVQNEEGTGGKNYITRSFAANEQASIEMVMPENYDGGTVTWWYDWISPTDSSAGDTVIFGLRGSCIANGAVIAAAQGAQTTITDTLLTGVGRVHKSPESGALTIDGAAAGDYIIWELERTGGTMTEEAPILAVCIRYGTNNSSDE